MRTVRRYSTALLLEIWTVFVYMFGKRLMAHPTDPIFSVGLVALLLLVVLRVQARRVSAERIAAS